MAEMVWCVSCGTVVWAYDHQPHMDIRGLVNMFGLPCPNCHRTHCFDGWGTNSVEELAKCYPNEVFDGWSAMKIIAKKHHLEWKPSPDNRWRIGAHEGLRLMVEQWKAEHKLTSNPLIQAKVVVTLMLLFCIIAGVGVFSANALMTAIGITGVVTAGILYLTSRQRWIDNS